MAPTATAATMASSPATQTPTPEPTKKTENNSSPSVAKAGQLMLIFAMLLIFLVIFCVTLHFWLQRRKRQQRGTRTKRSKDTIRRQSAPQTSELDSRERKVHELAGTIVCEIPGIPDPVPQELDAQDDAGLPEEGRTGEEGDVSNDDESDANSVQDSYRSTESEVAAATMGADDAFLADARDFAVYWSARL
ncbi:hypothetical protein P154DRAFT_579417 [Amniculicola lignicola CBS 123094]|uniref:Uncharacterized protein n=1 Tax=Amniculicola lignicola CBS 123094 TaxID=1392246 RepID=A0A6A5W7T8_9PLEO|nr:hypothetical protein P154DRAFT_579417 [Amniculicola lignicola CBS 123094]